MKKYVINDTEYNFLPIHLWPNTSPITDAFFIAHGGVITEVDDPVEEEGEIRYSKISILHILSMACCRSEFFKALKELDLYDFWDAANEISTAYPNYEQISSSIIEKMRSYREAALEEEGVTEALKESSLHSFDESMKWVLNKIDKEARIN